MANIDWYNAHMVQTTKYSGTGTVVIYQKFWEICLKNLSECLSESFIKSNKSYP